MSTDQGRRRKNREPSFPREEVDRLLVHGEKVELEGGKATARYPTYRELGERFGVSFSLIAQYSKQHNCLLRRKQLEKKALEISDAQLAELRADEITVSRDDAVRMIDRFCLQFEEALKEGRVRCDNPSDFNVLLRLRAFILGDADSRAQLLDNLSMEEMEERHKEFLKAQARPARETGTVVELPTQEKESAKDQKVKKATR